MLEFKTDKIDTELIGLPNDTLSHDVDSILEWEVDLECRSWGIKSIDVRPRILNVSWVREAKGDETHELLTIDFSDEEYKVITELDTLHMGFLIPSQIIIDFNLKEINVQFR